MHAPCSAPLHGPLTELDPPPRPDPGQCSWCRLYDRVGHENMERMEQGGGGPEEAGFGGMGGGFPGVGGCAESQALVGLTVVSLWWDQAVGQEH